MKLSIIIISYNTEELIDKLLKTIPINPEWEIVIVDNASSDGTVQMVRKKFPYVKLILNQTNLGFAKANNLGIKESKSKYVLILNSDTLIVKDAIESLIKFIKKSDDLGIASCQLLNQDGSIQPQGGYLPKLSNIAFWMLLLDDLPIVGKIIRSYQVRDPNFFKKENYTGWLSGTAMMVKREVFEKIGLFDENLFMYGEDVDFCLRASKAGFKVAITPNAKVMHFKQASSKGNPGPALVGEFKAMRYIFYKHKPKWELPLVRLLLKSGALLRMFIFGILQGSKARYAIYKKAFQVA